jgi:GNAT superfamily N-acetyltransferase
VKVIRAVEEWQKAGVYYVRFETMCRGFHVPLEMEFGEDKPGDEYVLVMEDEEPVAACALHCLDAENGKIGRVATRPEFRRKNYGKAAIEEAERWLAEKGIQRIYINAREEAVGFYEKLDYTPDYTKTSGSGDFKCVMTQKEITA